MVQNIDIADIRARAAIRRYAIEQAQDDERVWDAYADWRRTSKMIESWFRYTAVILGAAVIAEITYLLTR